MRQRGYTIVEVLIAAAMALLVLGALIRVFWFGRDVEREARASYLIRQDVDVAFRNVQDELRLTSLASIRVADDDSSFSFASPLKDNDFKSFQLTEYGVALWRSWANFTVVPKDENVGTLVRWEKPYPSDSTRPLASKQDPRKIEGDNKWNLLTGVVQPGRGVVTGSGAKGLKEMGDDTSNAGLQLRFVRREGGVDSLSTINPAQQSDESAPNWSKGTTRLVECRIQVADKSSESGNWSVYALRFRVRPRN